MDWVGLSWSELSGSLNTHTISQLSRLITIASCICLVFQIGWMYGSTTEDILTGLAIQKRGWKSIYIDLNPAAFLGCAPSDVVSSLTQQKRWATGLLEILVLNKNSPILATLFGKLQIKQCAAYLWILTWGLRSIPELCYALLPPYCLITNSHFFPTVSTTLPPNYNIN